MQIPGHSLCCVSSYKGRRWSIQSGPPSAMTANTSLLSNMKLPLSWKQANMKSVISGNKLCSSLTWLVVGKKLSNFCCRYIMFRFSLFSPRVNYMAQIKYWAWILSFSFWIIMQNCVHRQFPSKLPCSIIFLGMMCHYRMQNFGTEVVFYCHYSPTWALLPTLFLH